MGIQDTGLTLTRYCDILLYFVFQDLIKTEMNINSAMYMTNFAAQETNILYGGWSKVFVKYGVGKMEIKNRRQRNADIVYIFRVFTSLHT